MLASMLWPHALRVAGLAASLSLLVACGRAPSGPALASGASECGSCHVEHAEQFAGAPHARSSGSPVFLALLPRVERAWGSAARARCVGCHSPEHGTDDTVTCVSCHAAVGHRGASDGRLVIDLDAPLLGPFEGASAPHATRTSDLLSSSELCATCHEVSGPALFVEHTGSEHLDAVRATAAPECATCHLPRIDDGPVAPLGEPRARHDHRFVGLDPRWGAPEAGLVAAREESRALLDSALELRVARTSDTVVVELENVGAAHAVPTGVAFLRDVWVDVEIDGVLSARVIELGDRPMRAGTPVALPTDADRIESRALLPFEVRRAQLSAAPTQQVSATLRFRAIRASALAALDLPMREAPVVDVRTVGP